MQARQRVSTAADGELQVEDYEKPRVTTKSSFGGADSVNAGVPEVETEAGAPAARAGTGKGASDHRDVRAPDGRGGAGAGGSTLRGGRRVGLPLLPRAVGGCVDT
eukprot:1827714-Pleurochrysis_carterae.AAC.1